MSPLVLIDSTVKPQILQYKMAQSQITSRILDNVAKIGQGIEVKVPEASREMIDHSSE